MKGDVRVAPNGGVIIHKGLSTKAWFRAFSTGTVVGGAAGVVGGFALAQAIYSDEHQRDSVRRAVKITGVAVAASMLAVCASSIRNVLMDTPSSNVSTRTSSVAKPPTGTGNDTSPHSGSTSRLQSHMRPWHR